VYYLIVGLSSTSTPFPYTTLFRSVERRRPPEGVDDRQPQRDVRREQRHQPRLLLRLGSGPGGARQPQREVVADAVDVVVGAVVRHLAQRQPSPLRALHGATPTR